MTGRVCLFVPMKSLASAKSRLAGALPDDRRRLLATAMFVHVVNTVRNHPDREATVIAGDGAVARLCERLEVKWMKDDSGELNVCLKQAFAKARGGPWAIAAFVPADLPLLTFADVDALLKPASEGRPSIAPDRSGKGTNGIAIPAAVDFVPMMGPDSAQRHRNGFESSGGQVEIVRSRGLALDIDTPADLAILEAERSRWWEEAALAVDELGPSFLDSPHPYFIGPSGEGEGEGTGRRLP
ncbi:MAG: 2-phospho-L-lactate guanylyltransferase [Chloroflexi bacterium]|nr:2-phospho-L-lactate guanylyltransferase [Chloroflexota bacterium]